MRLEQLQYLVDVAQTHSINSTAARCFATQQSVSVALKNLEQELDTLLLNRSATGVSLTRQGKETVKFSQDVLEGLVALKGKLAQINDQESNLCNESMENERSIRY